VSIPNSKQEWMGERAPSGWQQRDREEVAKVENGLVVSRKYKERDRGVLGSEAVRGVDIRHNRRSGIRRIQIRHHGSDEVTITIHQVARLAVFQRGRLSSAPADENKEGKYRTSRRHNWHRRHRRIHSGRKRIRLAPIRGAVCSRRRRGNQSGDR